MSTSQRRVRIATPLAALLLGCAGTLTPVHPSHAAPAAPGTAERPVTVIVRLDGQAALATRTTRGEKAAAARASALRDAHADLVTRARAAGITLTRRADYVSVLNGMAVEVAPSVLPRLRSLPGVAGVYPNSQVRAALADAVPHVHAPEVWQMRDTGGQSVTGTGQTVAILDTGIDYTHPDLGGCLGPDCRVVGGYDFVNGDSDPMDDNFHGTHVAGIIGASGQVTGVAPDVRFVAYKVLDAWGGGTVAQILAGLDRATDPFAFPRPSVINMSLGSPEGDGTDVLSQAVQAATEAGYVVVTAAGNSGPGGQSVGAPAAAPGAIAVGASTTGVVVPRARLVAPRDYDLRATRIEFSANPAPGTTTLDVVDVGAGTDADYDGRDVTGKAVLVDSGVYPFAWFQDALVAERHGAAAALIAQTDPADQFGLAATPTGAARSDSTGSDAARSDGASTGDDWPVGRLASGDDGRLDRMVALGLPYSSAEDLRGMLASGPARLEVEAVDATDTIPAFSSRGPSGLLRAKPDLVAPGVEVRSTVPVGQFGEPYGRVSGTSMAAPMVAGAAVLLHQLHPEWSNEVLAAALTGTARRLDGAGPLAQGAGLLDVAAAARPKVIASPRLVSFGLASHGGRTVHAGTTVTLTNTSGAVEEFDLHVSQADPPTAEVTLTPSHLRLLAGERASVRVDLAVADPGRAADVSGWLTADVDGSGGEDLSVPYTLAVRPLDVFASPDPTVGDGEVFVRAPAPLAVPPTLTVRGPHGYRVTVTAALDHGYWWRARVPTRATGAYQVEVTATAAPTFGNATLSGTGGFEKVDPTQGSGWTPVGPHSSGGEMAPSPTDPDDMLVTSDRATTLFRTTDGGSTWRQASTVPVAGGSGFGAQPMLAADPTRPGRYYLGVDSGMVDPTYRGALFVTDDSGDHWRRLPYPDDRVFRFALGADGRTLAVASQEAFHLSVDGGLTWRDLWGPWRFVVDVAVDGDRVYLGTSDGLYAYSDVHGQITGPELLFGNDPWNPAEAVAARDGRIFLWNSDSSEPIRMSTDAGATWRSAYQPPAEFMIGRDLRIVGDDVWATSDRGAWVGHGLGAEWTQATMPPARDWVGDIEPLAGRLVLSVDSGLYSTADDGATYRRIGVQGVDVAGLAMTSDGAGNPTLLAATTWDTYRTALDRQGLPTSPEWGHAASEGGFENGAMFVRTAPGDPRTVYKVLDQGFGTFGVYRSDDGGTRWRLLHEGQSEPTALLVHPADPDSVYVAYRYYDLGQGVLVSHDGGVTWRREPVAHAFAALAGDPRDASRVYAGDPTGLYVSEDAGHSYRQLDDHPTSSIALDPSDANHVVTGGENLYVSRDGARSFTVAGYGPYALHVADLAFGPKGRIYAATSSFYDEGLLVGGRGVLVSTDGGFSYTSMSRGLPDLDALSLTTGQGRLYVGVRGGGVYVTAAR